ncbi:60 kDa SS-A/Ro ribonucleoprotein [Desmophyllum pertusum]|uniref:60 kDa SS-A/Ro ribonucleoprotein n=1 Tax=Desmophyllum pertusum TaxID=174260 RepID=A0A9W9YIW6_9CNID|nr:60 kDa SS-A/Ro ribonucleoprotein [Desmophyllum pertusum]
MAQQQPPDVEMVADPSNTPQSQPIAANQVQNEAGGFVWKVDDLERFRRFLVLGSEGGTYYATERTLGQENAQALLRLIAEGRGTEAVKIIVQYSTEGRTAKQDPIILSLALCARSTHLETKRAAYAALNQVLRIPTHLFKFVEICETLSKPKTGWGRAHRKAIQKWYTGKRPRGLAIAVTKYKQRNGWSHRDLFRLCHVKPTDPAIQFIVKYVIKGFDAVQPDAAVAGVGQDVTSVCTFLRGVEAAKTMTEDELVGAIREHGLVREHIPTNHLNSAQIWEALLDKMPMTAMIRNLGKMTNVGVLAPLSDGMGKVCEKLRNEQSLKDARVHPFSILLALKQYQAGQGEKGKLTWTPNQAIVTALDEAFYLAFKTVQPTNKRFLLAIDVSGSMSWGNCNGTTITPRIASAAMAMLTARTEPQYHFVGFSHHLVPLNINSTQRLDTVLRTIEQVPMGGTDCAQPMIYAKEKNLKVDVFIIYTDCETWAGPVHPSEALKQYRAHSGIDAKLIVCAMTSNGFTLADPDDRGMLDMAGFDAAAPDIIRQFVEGF